MRTHLFSMSVIRVALGLPSNLDKAVSNSFISSSTDRLIRVFLVGIAIIHIGTILFKCNTMENRVNKKMRQKGWGVKRLIKPIFKHSGGGYGVCIFSTMRQRDVLLSTSLKRALIHHCKNLRCHSALTWR